MKKLEANANFNCNESHRITYEEALANRDLIEAVARRVGLNVFYWDELVDDVALHCCNKTLIYEPSKGSVKALLARIASNKAVDMLRKQGRGPVALEEEKLDFVAGAAECDDPSEAYERNERNTLVHRAVEEMYRKFQSRKAVDAYLSRVRDGQSVKDIARNLGVTEHFVHDAVSKGRKRFKRIFNELNRNDNRS